MKNVHITQGSLTAIHDALKVAVDAKKEYQVSITVLDNSLRARQRALAQIWFKQIDDHWGSDPGYAESYCKLKWGLKIATIQDPDLAQIIRRMLGCYEYEQKLEIIRLYPEWFPVLRDKGGLDAENQARYLNCIQINMANEGVILSSPKERDLLNCREANR